MLSKEMEVEVNESFKKEKKRKKNETPKSSKKQKLLIDAKTIEEQTKEQLLRELDEELAMEALKDHPDVINKAMEIEDEYVTPVKLQKKKKKQKQNQKKQITTEPAELNEEEQTKEQLLRELDEELAIEALKNNLDVINKSMEIEDAYVTPVKLQKKKKKQKQKQKKQTTTEPAEKEKQTEPTELNEELVIKALNYNREVISKAMEIEDEYLSPGELQKEKEKLKQQQNQKKQKPTKPAEKEKHPEPAENETQPEPEEETQPEPEEETKKPASFDGKKFRRQILNKQTCYGALKEFIEICCSQDANRDYALEYLESGGNTSEILRIIELADAKSASFVLPIIEALTLVLVKIISSHPQKQLQAEESCREFINKHFAVLKSMMALNSTTKQRKTALKLLTVMVSLSASTAKEVLPHATFDQALMELLYQPSNVTDGSSVRTHFIHFLVSFLIDGHSAVIIAFLEKRDLFSSIFPGLIYDPVDVVNLVLTTLQTRVLEDKAISKTTKMTFFNTQLIQTLLNLYNWKGPTGWNPKKRKEINAPVNQTQKTEVCEAVQKFLLCLCTSKHGIIFFDPSVGWSTKKYNPLLLTVLSNLPNPWTNTYKRELVLRICVACPDVVKPVLASVEGLLEPRGSNNWTNVIDFVRELIQSLNPEALQQFLVKSHNKQVAFVMQQLCTPQTILVRIAAGMNEEDLQIRSQCVYLLNIMLNSADSYLTFIRKIPGLSPSLVRNFMSGYLNRCLPPGSVLLNDWYKSITAADSDKSIDQNKLNEYLTRLLDVLYQYNTFCPGLVENITKDIDVRQFLNTIDELSKTNPDSYDLHIKAINLLISCDITIFAPSKPFFSYALPLLFKFYYHTEGQTQLGIEKMLIELFKLTSIFDCCTDEIMIWLYSILELPSYEQDLFKLLTKVLVHTHFNFLKYSKKMTNLKEQFTDGSNYRVIIENLSSETKNTLKLNTHSKHRILSPFILGFLNQLLIEKKNISLYLKVSLVHLLHYQTNPTILANIISQEKYSSIIVSSHLRKYFSNWSLSNVTNKVIPENTVYYKLIHFLTEGEISDLPQFIEYSSEHSKYFTKQFVTNLTMFSYTQKSVTNDLTSTFQTKCYDLLLHIINNSDDKSILKSILDHPLMLDSFSLTSTNNESSKLSTEFIINIIKELLKTKSKSELEIYLSAYQMKLVEEIHKLLDDYSKNTVVFKAEQFMDTVKLFDLSYDNCSEILDTISKIPVSSFKSDENKALIFLKLQSYILGHESNYINFKPFSNEILKQINLQMIELNKTDINLEELEVNLCNYIRQYPHAIINFDSALFESLISKQITTKASVRLASILLEKNPKLYLDIFIKNLDKMYDKRELVFSLINAVMNLKADPIKSLLENVHKQYEQMIIKYLNKPQKASNYLVENYQVIIKLIVEQLKAETCKEFCAKTHKFDSAEIHHFDALTTIFNKTILGASSEDLKQKYVTNYITTSMNLLINLLKRPTKTDEDWIKVEKIAKQFSTYTVKVKNVYKIELTELKVYSGAVFQTFGKLCLKFGLQEKPILVHLLKHLCSLTPPNSGDIADLGVLFEMAISHSESLNILLSDDEKKAPLLNLLLTVCKRCKSVMIKAHIPIWLSAYEATLCETDQYLLQLLSLYETANIGFHEFRPYLWGKAAVAHYSVRSTIETTLWRQPRPKEVLDLFNENRIVHTVEHFPWTRRLHDHTLYSDSDIEVYDPAFYLPLLSHLLAPESTIRWYQCTQRGIVSLPIIALTSENEGIRAAACNVLARFHGHLEAATYAKQRFLWLHLIEAVCRGTSILPSLRPCTIVAVFLARCSIIFTRPDHPLYSTLGNYISAKECPNFNVVPELLTMLHSTDVNHNAHRNFILEVIRDGLCTDEDLKVLYKSVAFKLIMDLYNSVLTDYEGKKIILEILAAAVTLQNGVRTLVSSYNVISWLHAVSQQFTKNSTELLYVFIKILNNLITSFEDELFKHLQFNVLLLLVSVIDTFKNSRLELMHLVKYIQVLYKVYDGKAHVLTKTQLRDLLTMSAQLNCQICSYYLDFGADFVETPTLLSDDVDSVGCYYLKLLTLKWIQTNQDL